MSNKILSCEWILTESNPTYHGWPTLCRLEGDHLGIVCSGHREKHVCPFGRVYLYESFDGGKSWGAPKQLTNGPLDDRDSGLCVASDGSWLVNYFTSLAFTYLPCTVWRSREEVPESWKAIERSITLETLHQEHGPKLLRSTDQGKSWTRIDVPVNNVHGPSRMRDGSLLWAGKERTGILSTARIDGGVAVFRSFDNGLTWERYSDLPVLADDPQNKWHELHQLQTSDGRIIVQIRNHAHEAVCTEQCESTDGGRTWTTPKIVCAGFPSHLLNLRSGKVLMTYGWRGEGGFGIRYKVGESTHDGMIWGEEEILTTDGDTSDLGYPSTVELEDGTLVTAWYQFRRDAGLASLRVARWNYEL